MVSNVDLSVVVHFWFISFVKCIEQQFLKDLNTLNTDCTSGGGSPVRYHVHVTYQKNQVYKMLF